MTLQTRNLDRTGSSGLRGGRRMTPGSGERQPEGGRRNHVDPQDLDGCDRQGQPEQHGGDDGERFAAVRRQSPGDHLLEIVVHRPALVHGRDDRGEVVVGQHHLGRFLGRLGSLPTHGDADVCLLERGRIVHAVAGHHHHLTVSLQRLDDAQLVLRAGARKNRRIAYDGPELAFVHPIEVRTCHSYPIACPNSERPCDCRGRGGMITGDHFDPDPR
jgi:hypothetical protein